ncbi:MAG: hypothetical protein IKX62_02405 [Bacteroidales bacterium]|nr:hypothetical protein [Bacteroidales bacterium]
MKRLFFLLAATAFAVSLSAQVPDRPMHNIQIGLGTYTYGGIETRALRLGQLAGRVSYGLDIPVAGAWSVMPEVGAKFYWQGVFFIGAVGADFDSFSYLDFTVSGRYHLEDGSILGLGPMLSYTGYPDKYYIDADPSDPLNRQAKNKRLGLSLRPSITFPSTRRWRFGLEAEIGLLNAMVQYPEMGVTGNKHIHAVRFFTVRSF